MSIVPVSRRWRGPPDAKTAAAARATHTARGATHGPAPPLRKGGWQQDEYHANKDRCTHAHMMSERRLASKSRLAAKRCSSNYNNADLQACESDTPYIVVADWQADGSGSVRRPACFMVLTPQGCLSAGDLAVPESQSTAGICDPTLVLCIAANEWVVSRDVSEVVTAATEQIGLSHRVCASAQQLIAPCLA